MSIARLVIVPVVALLAACGSETAPKEHAGHPYAGEQAREIAGLSPEETADLLNGRGMELALAAELNHYPGPLHVLELADQLSLSEDQRSATESVRASMQEEAKELGGRIVELERDLDAAFGSGSITDEDVQRRTSEIASLEGSLRSLHLEAHLRMVEILTPEQISRYDELRGYAGDHGS